jgi:hypothetical protein
VRARRVARTAVLACRHVALNISLAESARTRPWANDGTQKVTASSEMVNGPITNDHITNGHVK